MRVTRNEAMSLQYQDKRGECRSFVPFREFFTDERGQASRGRPCRPSLYTPYDYHFFHICRGSYMNPRSEFKQAESV